MTLDFTFGWGDMFAVGQIVLTALAAWFLLYMRAKFLPRGEADSKLSATEARLTAQSERLNAGDARFQLIEDRMKAIPSPAQLHELALGIERLSGDLRTMGARLEGVEALHDTLKHQVSIMDEFLRTK